MESRSDNLATAVRSHSTVLRSVAVGAATGAGIGLASVYARPGNTWYENALRVGIGAAVGSIAGGVQGIRHAAQAYERSEERSRKEFELLGYMPRDERKV